MRARVARGLRVAMWAVLPGELALVVCLVAGVRIPGGVLLAAEALVVGMLALEAYVMWPLYTVRRRAGDTRREAGLAVVRAAVPVALRRLIVHEFRALHSLGLWTVRRRHRIPEGAATGFRRAPGRSRTPNRRPGSCGRSSSSPSSRPWCWPW
ncbi:hypothetical protein [Streptomyces sp. MBT61]|uniref:hypothetical protein n=1 Tax=Streptomyces sp. MBT61 TaxID=1488392 RepID=UPI001F159AF5|nr:hypothetical protein [Streptomyces sp. MBT61]